MAAPLSTGAILGPQPAPSGRSRYCARCETIADAMTKAGKTRPEVREVQSWVSEWGLRYYSGTCRPCADIEWSERFQATYAAASEAQRPKLREILGVWRAKGHNYHGTLAMPSRSNGPQYEDRT